MIEQSRAMRGFPYYDKDEIQPHLGVWARALAKIETSDLSPAFDRAVQRYADIKTPFGPANVLAAFAEIESEFGGATARYKQQVKRSLRASKNTYECHYCKDIGYQIVWQHVRGLDPSTRADFTCALQRESRLARGARPCVCASAPIGRRSQFPICEPQYRRNHFDEWEPVNVDDGRYERALRNNQPDLMADLPPDLTGDDDQSVPPVNFTGTSYDNDGEGMPF